MTEIAHLVPAASQPCGFVFATAAAEAAETIDRSLAACARAMSEMAVVSVGLNIPADLAQPAFEASLETLTSLVRARRAMARARKVARRIADKSGVVLKWGDHGCPGPAAG